MLPITDSNFGMIRAMIFKSLEFVDVGNVIGLHPNGNIFCSQWYIGYFDFETDAADASALISEVLLNTYLLPSSTTN